MVDGMMRPWCKPVFFIQEFSFCVLCSRIILCWPLLLCPTMVWSVFRACLFSFDCDTSADAFCILETMCFVRECCLDYYIGFCEDGLSNTFTTSSQPSPPPFPPCAHLLALFLFLDTTPPSLSVLIFLLFFLVFGHYTPHYPCSLYLLFFIYLWHYTHPFPRAHFFALFSFFRPYPLPIPVLTYLLFFFGFGHYTPSPYPCSLTCSFFCFEHLTPPDHC